MIIRHMGNKELEKHAELKKKLILPNLVKVVNRGLAFPDGG